MIAMSSAKRVDVLVFVSCLISWGRLSMSFAVSE
jgi:hypothetical protein